MPPKLPISLLAGALVTASLAGAATPALAASPARHMLAGVSVKLLRDDDHSAVSLGKASTASTAIAAALSSSGTAQLAFSLPRGLKYDSATLLQLVDPRLSISFTAQGLLSVASQNGTITRALPSSQNGHYVNVILSRLHSKVWVSADGHFVAAVPEKLSSATQIVVASPYATAVKTTYGGTSTGSSTGSSTGTPTSSSGTSSTSTSTPSTSGSSPQPVAGPASTPTSTSTSGSTSSGAWPGNPFAPTSFWNAPLAASQSIDPSSSTYVHDLVNQVDQYNPFMNTTSYSDPVYVVPAGQPTVAVTLTKWGPDLQSEFNAVPIPNGAAPAQGTDETMTVWQPSTDKMWEFWGMVDTSSGWTTKWGGEMDNVSTNPGYFQHVGQTTSWGASGTGLPLLGGLVTLHDLQTGVINHALALAVPNTEKETLTWPAQRDDGWSTAANALPEGIRFRLDPSINIASLHLPKMDAMLAQAAQTYGIVVRDGSGAVDFYGQDPSTTASNPWPAAFGNHYVNTVLSQFPWASLQALPVSPVHAWSAS